MSGSWKTTLVFSLFSFATGALIGPVSDKGSPLSLAVAFFILAVFAAVGLILSVCGTFNEIDAANRDAGK